jgi:hypothetical protein
MNGVDGQFACHKPDIVDQIEQPGVDEVLQHEGASPGSAAGVSRDHRFVGPRSLLFHRPPLSLAHLRQDVAAGTGL